MNLLQSLGRGFSSFVEGFKSITHEFYRLFTKPETSIFYLMVQIVPYVIPIIIPFFFSWLWRKVYSSHKKTEEDESLTFQKGWR